MTAKLKVRLHSRHREILLQERHPFPSLNIGVVLLCLFLSAPLPQSLNGAEALGASEDEWTNERAVLQISIELSKDATSALRKEPRQYVRGIVTERAQQFPEVAIHLKGSVGSFRPIDDKPSFTLNFSRFQTNRTFHGRTKIHLNNSVEDPTYLNEKLGSLIFSKAGIATPAVQHAAVRINGRPLGLYVLKEGFTREFLARHFSDATGDLYDSETALQSSDDLDTDRGRSVGSPSALNKLFEASRIPEPKQRWSELERVVDLDQFLSFMAIEVMICHRDGYSLARNNYRLYHDPSRDRIVFLPHGMDQLFGRPDFPWRPNIMGGAVAQIVMSTPQGQQRYQQRFGTMVTNIFNVQELTNTVDRLALLLRPFVAKAGFQEGIDNLKRRIAERKAFLLNKLSQPAPRPVAFRDRTASPAHWTVADAPDRGLLNQTNGPDGVATLHIAAGPVTTASWRSKVLLERGSYRFEGRARTDRVVPLPYGRNKGARLRVSGNYNTDPGLLGTRPWTPIAVEFTVRGETEEIELICELRATAGNAWFDQNSLRLVQTRQPSPVQNRP